jgi:hypothetical protein
MMYWMVAKVTIPYVLRTRFANGIASLHASMVSREMISLLVTLGMTTLMAERTMINLMAAKVTIPFGIASLHACTVSKATTS